MARFSRSVTRLEPFSGASQRQMMPESGAAEQSGGVR